MDNAGRACKECLGQGRTGRRSRRRPNYIVYEPCEPCTGTGVVPGACPPRSLPSSPNWDVDVAIIGCGVGGSALALSLQQRGISVKVYERDSNFAQRKQGYGLTMQQGAIALARLGIAVAGTSSLAHVSFLPDGTVIGCYGRELDERAQGIGAADEPVVQNSHKTRHNIQIPRQRLRAILVHRLSSQTVEWNAKFEGYNEDEEGVTARFANLPPVRAGCIVGADGIFSLVRQQKYGHLPQFDLKYLGVIVVLGIVPNTQIELLHRRVTQTLDGETRIFTMPFTSSTDPVEEVDALVRRAAYFDQERFPPRSDVVMWQLSFKCTEEEAKSLGKAGGAALKREALRRCGHWHHPIPELLESTDPQDITGYPAYDRDVVKDFSVGQGGLSSRATVLGDAAHCMSPFKGQGANQALVDAISLGRDLSTVFGPCKTINPGTVAEVLRKFEQEMVVRAGEKVEGSRKAAAFLHSTDALVVGNCVRSAASFERREQIATKHIDLTDEERRRTVSVMFRKSAGDSSTNTSPSATPQPSEDTNGIPA